jgi:hypothetical protein
MRLLKTGSAGLQIGFQAVSQIQQVLETVAAPRLPSSQQQCSARQGNQQRQQDRCAKRQIGIQRLRLVGQGFQSAVFMPYQAKCRGKSVVASFLTPCRLTLQGFKPRIYRLCP